MYLYYEIKEKQTFPSEIGGEPRIIKNTLV
jgi:hypothetical protein